MKVLVLSVVVMSVMVVNTSAFTVNSDIWRKFNKINTDEKNLWSPEKPIEKKNMKDLKKKEMAVKKANKERTIMKSLEKKNMRLEKKHFDSMTEEKKMHVVKQKKNAAKRALAKDMQAMKKSARKMEKKSLNASRKEMKMLKKGKSNKKSQKNLSQKAGKKHLKGKKSNKESSNKKMHAKTKKFLKSMKQEEQAKRQLKKMKSANEKETRKAMKKLKRGHRSTAKKDMKRERFLLKHMKHEKDETILKEMKPYMKEGNTLEERRALKKLRLRMKRAAMEEDEKNKFISSVQTKSFLPNSFKTKDSGAVHKFSEEDIDASEEERKDSAGGFPIPDTLRLNSDNQLSDDESKEKEDSIEEDASQDIVISDSDLATTEASQPPTEASVDEIVNTVLSTTETASVAVPEDLDEAPVAVPDVTGDVEAEDTGEIPESVFHYGGESENESSGESDDQGDLEVVTLPAHTENLSEELANLLESLPTDGDSLDQPALSELGDNSLPASDDNLLEELREAVIDHPEFDAQDLADLLDSVSSSENEIEETSNEVLPSTTIAPTTTAAPTSWPWNIEHEGEESCGQARFGPEQRANRGQRMLKILQGKEALPGSFPWQVAILDKDRDLLCGGSLIAPRWVMTAAHCVRKKLHVRLYEHHVREKDGFEIEQKVRRVFRHPDYNSSTIDNDIALLRLPALPRIRDPETGRRTRGVTDRACLPATMEEFPPVGTRCLVMGWGKASAQHSFGTDVLMYTRLPLISRKACARANRKTITENMFCAGHYKGGSDTCSGDSGGPLLCPQRVSPTEETWVVYGVTSFGDGCGNAGKMGVYARVGNYLPWISSILSRYI